jgi:Ca2+-binding RTX toxin-like protein
VNVNTTVHGGDGVDKINVGAPGLLFDTLFTLSGIKGHLTVSGDAAVNTLNFKDNDEFSSARTYQLTASSAKRDAIATIDFNTVSAVNLTAGSGDDKITVNSSNLFIPWSIDGGGGNDTIVGPNLDDTWNLTGNNSGKFSVNVKFVNVENLTGGGLKDRFVFSNGMGVAGKINGGGGVDTLDYGLYSTAVAVDLPNAKSTGNSGIASIETVVGGTSLGDKLLGTGFIVSSTWNITAPNAGTFSGNGIVLAFSKVENLTGGANPDSFVFSNGAFVQGIVDGGGGNNTIDYSSYISPVAVNAASKAASATAGYANIQNFKGGQGTDTLTGLSFANTFNITGSNAGTLAGQFSFIAFENLVGGVLADSFVFGDGASLSGMIDGGSAADTLDYSAYTTAVKVDLQAGTATGVSAVKNVENVYGGSANDLIFGDLLDNILKGNGGNDQLFGRAGADLLLGGDGNDRLDGGADRNLLIGGLGNDILTGGDADDLLIGGTTNHDNNLFALSLMLGEWKRTDLDYIHRISDLRVTGVFGGQFKLNSANVVDDGVLDKLIGGLGQDWFWAFGADTTDKTSNELVN